MGDGPAISIPAELDGVLASSSWRGVCRHAIQYPSTTQVPTLSTLCAGHRAVAMAHLAGESKSFSLKKGKFFLFRVMCEISIASLERAVGPLQQVKAREKVF